jgi:hypothetical protein
VSAPCSEPFRRLARDLGGIACDGANPVVSLRSPASLENWTLPVVEVLMVGGAVLALAHAVRTRRRTGSPAGLALWWAAVAYVLVLEPPLYFPHQLGIAEHLDLIFVHNVFGVGFLYDRMPLYIVALYPAGIYLATALVVRLGVFERRGRLVGAVCVGVVHHCIYAPFDHLGPQLRWWAWNPDADVARPALGSVPLVSTVIFSLVGPALLVLVWRVLVAEPSARGTLTGRAWAWRAAVTGAVTPLLLPIASAPVAYLTLAEDPDHTVMAVVLAGAVLAAAVVALPALAEGRRAPAPATGDRLLDRYALVHGTVYLAVFAALWLAALPDLLDARSGRTPEGAPVGSPAYALAGAAVTAWLLTGVARRPASPEPGPEATATAGTGADVDDPVPGLDRRGSVGR